MNFKKAMIITSAVGYGLAIGAAIYDHYKPAEIDPNEIKYEIIEISLPQDDAWTNYLAQRVLDGNKPEGEDYGNK